MKKIILILCVLFIVINAQSQSFNKEIKLNENFLESTSIYPFTEKSAVTGIAISGHVTLNSDTSFVRIVVNDNNGNAYMLYEVYPMLVNERSFNYEYECEETCFLDNYFPNELHIHVKDANITIKKISFSEEKHFNHDNLRLEKKNEKNRHKVSRINEYIEKNKLLWLAEETDISKYFYSDKVKIFGEKYITFGYEYYSKGFYTITGPEKLQTSTERSHTTSHRYVDNFDWRSRHGANNPASAYYDGDELGTGWITPVVCQGTGCWYNNHYHCNVSKTTCEDWGGIWREAAVCWAFGPVAQVGSIGKFIL
ncbi:hypothetical protein LJC25_02705 [Bacteroidales bacterium OttesenSCG-928-K03]|nr:hypothetical protein [Bacteroidales bacterium OttesenSCG-928-K22]MDL2242618.1 hypothetical protein [Bacteroidales bacterium OttesenSCG-928-K03]